MNSERLLNVAKALRESKNPAEFTMRRYAHDCGTPACAFGHYAARTDLQDLLELQRSGCVVYAELEDGQRVVADYDDDRSMAHFGITADEANELFGSWGCDNAKTPEAAAKYIERFVERHCR